MFKTLFVLAFALTACSSGDDFEGPCDVNETQVCACPGGAMGAQTCLADRSAWGKCECAAGMAGAGGGAGTASLGEAGAMSAKECEVDADCPTTEKAYCIAFHCEHRLGLTADCGPASSHPDELCPPGYACTEIPGAVSQCRPK